MIVKLSNSYNKFFTFPSKPNSVMYDCPRTPSFCLLSTVSATYWQLRVSACVVPISCLVTFHPFCHLLGGWPVPQAFPQRAASQTIHNIHTYHRQLVKSRVLLASTALQVPACFIHTLHLRGAGIENGVKNAGKKNGGTKKGGKTRGGGGDGGDGDKNKEVNDNGGEDEQRQGDGV